MTTSAADLLKVLGSGIRPVPSNDPAKAPIESTAFADLLAGVRAGNVSSGQSLSFASGVDAELSADQLSRLSRAADAAEASGSARMLAIIDDQAVTIDVASRTIESVRPWDQAGMLTDIDSVVRIPPVESDVDLRGLFGADGATTAPSTASSFIPAPVRNQSVADLLARLSGSVDRAA